MSAAAVAAVFVLGACDWMEKKQPPNAKRVAAIAKARSRVALNACASRIAYERLMKVAFDDAIGIRNADPVNLATLAAHTVVRMEAPVVKSHDAALNVTVCSGRFILELPPGAERGFGGERRLAANIEYAAQPAADGSGLVYQVRGTEPIVYKLAAFDLRARVQRPGSADDPTRFAWVPNDEPVLTGGIEIRPAAFAGEPPLPREGLAAMPPSAVEPALALPPPLPRMTRIQIPSSAQKGLPSHPAAAVAKQAASATKPKAPAAPVRQASAEPKPKVPAVEEAKAAPKPKGRPVTRQAKAEPKKSSRVEFAQAAPKPKAKPVRLAKAETKETPKAKPKAKANAAPVREAKAEPKRKASSVREAKAAPKKKKAEAVRQAKAEPKKNSIRVELASAAKKKAKAAPTRLAKAEPKRAAASREAKAAKTPAKANAPIRLASAATKAKARPASKAKEALKTKSSRMREVEAALNDSGSETRAAAASKPSSKGKLAALRELVPAPKPKATPVRTAAVSTPQRSAASPARKAALSTPAKPRSSCDNARSRSGRIVCSDQRLAALHRSTASLDSYAMNSSDGRTRAEISRTRSQFLAWRERCQSQACIADAYQGRMEEIRDLMSR